MAIENFEFNSLSFLKLEPRDNVLLNTTIAALFIHIFE